MTGSTVPTKHRVTIPVQTVLITIIMAVFGIALIFQSDRWARTPAYGNLLRILPADVWGGVHLVIALLLALGLWLRANRTLGVLGHTFAFVLLLVWEGGFIVRYFTDGSTTVVNVVSWGTYLFLLVWSARIINERHFTG